MISPGSHYEEYLKGKTKEEIITAIRGLKQEIGHLKNSMENPDYDDNAIIHPDRFTYIYWTRGYLEKAKETLRENMKGAFK